MQSCVHDSPLGFLRRGIGLVATVCAITPYAQDVLAQTVTQSVFATVVDAPSGNDWVDESESVGDPSCTACNCDSPTAPFATQANGGTDWLTASSVGDFTSIPANYIISSVRVDFMCRYGLNTNGRIAWDYRVPGQRGFTSAGITSPTFASSSGNCSYRLGSQGEIVNGLGRPWTRADLDALQLRVRRCQDNCNSTTLRLRSFRVTVVAEAPVDQNDTCTGAIAVGVGTTPVVFDGVGENIDGSSSCEELQTADLWYSFTPQVTGAYQIDTCQTSVDTVLSVYNACGGSEIACDDDSCDPLFSWASKLGVVMTAGTRYLIRVGSYELGAAELRIAPTTFDPNDGCAGAIPVGTGTTSVVFDGVGEFADGTSLCQAVRIPELWYRFTPQVSGEYRVDSCQSDVDTVLSVFSACGGIELACDDDSCGTDFFSSNVTVQLAAGMPYLIRVGSYELGIAQMRIAPVQPDPNDACTGAIGIGIGTTPVVFDGFGEAVNAVASCEEFDTADLWYSFTPSTSGTFRIDTCQSELDTVLSVYAACGSIELACADDVCGVEGWASSVTLPLWAGTRYLIRVGSYELGDTFLNVGVAAPCDTVDFNNDGSLFDPTDIDAFLSVFSEGPCIPATAVCNDVDFNNDFSLFDPCDIDSFLLVFSEGPCTLCGE